MAEYIEKVAFNYAIREAMKKYPNSFYNGLEVARQIAHDFPAADVRHVGHGEWGKSLNPSFSPFDDSGAYRYRCNQCRHIQNYESYFCPNCGADMRETNDEKA